MSNKKSTFTIKTNSRGDRLYSQASCEYFEHNDIVDGGKIVRVNNCIVLACASPLLDDDLRNKAITWVEYANSSDDSCC